MRHTLLEGSQVLELHSEPASVHFVFFWGIIPGSISSQVGKRGSLAVLCNAQTPLGLEWASGCFLEGLMKALASSPAWWMRGM